jgi:hypothetical protein
MRGGMTVAGVSERCSCERRNGPGGAMPKGRVVLSMAIAAACFVAAGGAPAQGAVAAPAQLASKTGAPDGSAGNSNLVTKPVWANILSDKSLRLFYPDRAMRMGVGGHVTVECSVNQIGAFEKCKLKSEIPKGEAFGFAFLKISKYLKIGVTDESGQPTVNRPIRLAATFRVLDSRKGQTEINLYVVGD